MSISGTSMPSLKRSTAKTTLTSRSRRRRRALSRSSSAESADTATAEARAQELVGHEIGREQSRRRSREPALP